MEMSEIIKKLRTEYGWTQEELGKKLGLQKAIINKYENGSVENIKRTTIQKMAQLFHVSPAYLMGFTEEDMLMNIARKKAEQDELNGLMESYPLLKSMLLAGGKLMRTDPTYMEALVYTMQKMAGEK